MSGNDKPEVAVDTKSPQVLPDPDPEPIVTVKRDWAGADENGLARQVHDPTSTEGEVEVEGGAVGAH